MMMLLAVLFLAGCSAHSEYREVCHLDKLDADGQHFTRGQFPCKLSHHAVGPKD